MIIKVYYKPPFYEKRISYFRNMETFKENFSDTLRELYNSLQEVTREDFYNNLVHYVNTYSDKLEIEEVQ